MELPSDVGDAPILQLDGVSIAYSKAGLLGTGGRRSRRVVESVSLTVRYGECLGLVGESGSGKSSLARAIAGLVPTDDGRILFVGSDLSTVRGAQRRRIGRDLQMVFQDPYSSLNPRMTVRQLVTEPLVIHGLAVRSELPERCASLLASVGLDDSMATRYPRELSGGQRQRVAIARAVASRPSLIICDEAVSALDASIRAQVLNVLGEMRRQAGIAMLFIAHDLAIVRHMSDRVAVMHAGRLVEILLASEVPSRVAHPYTRALVAANPDPRRRHAAGGAEADLPTRPVASEGGAACSYVERCRLHVELGRPERCHNERPSLEALGPEHLVRCHYAEPVASLSGQRGPVGTQQHMNEGDGPE